MTDKPEDHPRVSVHKLQIYLDDNGLSHSNIADRLGTNKRSIPRWISGDNSPSLEFAQRLFDITGGYVKLMDWETDYTRAKRKRLSDALGKTKQE